MHLTDRRSVPEAAKVPATLTFKTAESSSGQLLAIEDAEGIVTAIVSVTGTLDEVDDVIMPGAYAETLVKRRPKVCWAHSWEHPIGRVLHIEELMPGDDRLPRQTKDGQPWDPKAGALVATMQFNMRTTEGKDAFEAVRFYSETGECEYSIGYNVPPGRATRDAQGTRHIKSLDLYELSVVLFGAHTMTGTISIKAALAAAIERKSLRGRTGTVTKSARTAAAALAAVRQGYRVEGKAMPGTPTPAAPVEATPAAGDDPEVPDAAPDFTQGVMIALYPDPAAADKIAEHTAGPDDTTDRADLHVTLAYLGDVTDLDMTADELFKRVGDAVQGERTLTGTIGGIGMFPDSGDGAPTWAPVDVPGLGLLRETIASTLGDVVRTDHGFTPHMTLGYDLGLIDPLPEVPVTFDHVAVVYGQQTRKIDLGAPASDDDTDVYGTKAFLPRLTGLPTSEVARLTAVQVLSDQGPEAKAGGADRNRGGADDLRKYWLPGGEGGAKIAWGTPGDFTRCVANLGEHMTPENAKGYCANRHKEATGMWPGDKDNKSAGYDPAMEAPAGETKAFPHMPGSYQERDHAISAAVNEALRGDQDDDGRFEWDHVSIDATWDNSVIATRMRFDTDLRETFEMGYAYSREDGVDLGDPEPVELTVVAVSDTGEEVDAPVGDALPFAEALLDLAGHFKAAQHAAVETKSGRVLSGANERRIREAMENLVNVLGAAGMDLALVEGHQDRNHVGGTDTGDNVVRTVDPDVDTSTTAPSASGGPRPAGRKDLPVHQTADGRFTLDVGAHQALMARLREGL